MRIILILFVFAGFSVVALAAEVKVAPADCTRVMRHSPAPDVAYRPGTDVDGEDVVPADAGGGVRLEMPREVKIPIIVNLRRRYGIPAGRGGYQAEAQIGVVTVSDGRVMFNGVPLQPEDEAALIAACRAAQIQPVSAPVKPKEQPEAAKR